MKQMLQTLRNAAVDSNDDLLRFNLNLTAAELEDSLIALTQWPTEENLRRVNGHWAHGVKLMGHAEERLRQVTK